MTREEFVQEFYDALEDAYDWLDINDIDDNDDNARWEAYEDRFHCSVCTVRGLLEIIWPVAEDYIQSLEAAAQ
jgi:hypothetical protein